MNPTEPSSKPPPLPQGNPFHFEPMPADAGPLQTLETLLKHPGRIIHELHGPRRVLLAGWLLAFALAGMALYGVVVGSLSGGAQLWIAPVKLAIGTLLSLLICLPSLYVFSCIAGSDARLGSIAGALAAAACLSALLLIGFVPVAWIFSQSTESVPLLGALHLIFWLIGLFFGLRILRGASRFRGETSRGYLRTWSLIFILVSLQMTTTLRPIISRSDYFLPPEKKFFLTNWAESLGVKK